MVGKVLSWISRWRVTVVMAILALTVLTAPRQVERIGDNLQIALPMAAWGCAAVNGQAGEYALRFFAMWFATHGTKRALGDMPLNIRPHGGDHGFPSAHTSAATFGASSLVHDCLTGNPVAKGVAVIAAGFVGGSRIEAGAHDIWQVLFGVLYGWGFDRVLRRPSRARTFVKQSLARLGGVLTAPIRRLRRT